MAIRIFDKDGTSTGWLSKKPTERELKRLNINQLLVIAKRKKIGLKKVLIDFLKNVEIKH